jgi:integrase/recombinase XerD
MECPNPGVEKMETRVRAFLTTLQTQGRYAQNTILGYQNDLQHFSRYLHQYLGRPPQITDFNAELVTAYLKFGCQSYQPNTVKRRLATLKHFARFLQPTGEIEAFQFPAIGKFFPPPTDTNRSKKISLPSTAQISSLTKALIADSRPQARRDEAIIGLILEVGLTVSRLIALNMADFDRNNNRLCLKKVTGENWWFHIRNSGQFLQQYLLEGRPELNSTPQETALFISQMGGRVSRQGVWQICQRWGRRIGLPGGLSPRILRYTAVRRMLKAGYAEKTIQVILEHKNLEATQGILQQVRGAESLLLSQD